MSSRSRIGDLLAITCMVIAVLMLAVIPTAKHLIEEHDVVPDTIERPLCDRGLHWLHCGALR